MTLFDPAKIKAEVSNLEKEMMEDGFWDDHQASAVHVQKINHKRKLVETYESLTEKFQSASESVELLKMEDDKEFKKALIDEVKGLETKLEDFSMLVLMSHDYDQRNAIVEIHPGAGGTESQDFAEMLYRMYTRWAQKKNYKIQVMDYLDGDDAGLKSVTFAVRGDFSYGYLKAEKGVHRLVRISPFDSSGRRHTSFSSVDVSPEIDDSVEITINPEDIEVDTYRSSGAGGQHVNKTDSAVRITHKETGIVTTSQSGRSQIKNREEAMNMLKSKLYQRQIEEQQKEMAKIKGVHKEIGWGSQIRSYVVHPYTMVKDHRTNEETSQLDDVFDGDIDKFIESYLKMNVGD